MDEERDAGVERDGTECRHQQGLVPGLRAGDDGDGDGHGSNAQADRSR